MQADPRYPVDRYMLKVSAACNKHLTGDARTEVYNRAYEAVLDAMVDIAALEYKRGYEVAKHELVRKTLTVNQD